MNAAIAEAVMILAAVNAAAALVLVPVSFILGSLALEGLEKLDLWMRRRNEKL